MANNRPRVWEGLDLKLKVRHHMQNNPPPPHVPDSGSAESTGTPKVKRLNVHQFNMLTDEEKREIATFMETPRKDMSPQFEERILQIFYDVAERAREQESVAAQSLMVMSTTLPPMSPRPVPAPMPAPVPSRTLRQEDVPVARPREVIISKPITATSPIAHVHNNCLPELSRFEVDPNDYERARAASNLMARTQRPFFYHDVRPWDHRRPYPVMNIEGTMMHGGREHNHAGLSARIKFVNLRPVMSYDEVRSLSDDELIIAARKRGFDMMPIDRKYSEDIVKFYRKHVADELRRTLPFATLTQLTNARLQDAWRSYPHSQTNVIEAAALGYRDNCHPRCREPMRLSTLMNGPMVDNDYRCAPFRAGGCRNCEMAVFGQRHRGARPAFLIDGISVVDAKKHATASAMWVAHRSGIDARIAICLQCNFIDIDFFNEGGFNPYGNGQTDAQGKANERRLKSKSRHGHRKMLREKALHFHAAPGFVHPEEADLKETQATIDFDAGAEVVKMTRSEVITPPGANNRTFASRPPIQRSTTYCILLILMVVACQAAPLSKILPSAMNLGPAVDNFGGRVLTNIFNHYGIDPAAAIDSEAIYERSWAELALEAANSPYAQGAALASSLATLGEGATLLIHYWVLLLVNVCLIVVGDLIVRQRMDTVVAFATAFARARLAMPPMNIEFNVGFMRALFRVLSGMRYAVLLGVIVTVARQNVWAGLALFIFSVLIGRMFATGLKWLAADVLIVVFSQFLEGAISLRASLLSRIGTGDWRKRAFMLCLIFLVLPASLAELTQLFAYLPALYLIAPFALISCLSVFTPEYAEMIEESVMHSACGGIVPRTLLAGFELLRDWVLTRGDLNVPARLTVCVAHVVWQAVPLPLAIVCHLAWNKYIASAATLRRDTDVHLGAYLPGNMGNRTFDMAIGNAEYHANVYDAAVDHHTTTYYPTGHFPQFVHDFFGAGGDIHIGTTSNRRVGMYCPEFASHLRSIRSSCHSGDTPEMIRSRVVALARSFTTLDMDRGQLSLGWVQFTTEVVIRELIDHTLVGSLSVEEGCYLYGYMLEQATNPIRPTVGMTISTSYGKVMDLATQTNPIACQLFATPTKVPPAPDPRDTAMKVAGCMARVGRAMPEPDANKLMRLENFVWEFCSRNLMPLSPDDDISVETWLPKTNYSLSRQEELLRKKSNVVRLLPKHRRAKCFIKNEHLADYKIARIIASRSDEFKVAVGPVLKCIEERVFKLPHFIKKVPLKDRPSYINEMFTRLVGIILQTDFTSFEASHVPDVVRACVRPLYLYMTSRHPEALRQIRIHLAARMGEQVLKFSDFEVTLLIAKLLSGEMDTSLGNGWTNLMWNLFIVSEKSAALAIPFDPDVPIGVFEGDDGLMKLDERVAPTEQDYAELGAICKIERRDSVEQSCFCGIMFHPDDLACLPDVREALGTFPFSHLRDSHASPRRKRMLLVAKAASYLYQYQGCPILDPLCRRVLQLCAADLPYAEKFIRNDRSLDGWQRDRALQALGVLTKLPERPIGMSSRVLIEQAYGVTIAEQVRLESVVPFLSFSGTYEVCYDAPASWSHFFANYYRSNFHSLRRNGNRLHRLAFKGVPLTGSLTRAAVGVADLQVFHQEHPPSTTPSPGQHRRALVRKPNSQSMNATTSKEETSLRSALARVRSATASGDEEEKAKAAAQAIQEIRARGKEIQEKLEARTANPATSSTSRNPAYTQTPAPPTPAHKSLARRAQSIARSLQGGLGDRGGRSARRPPGRPGRGQGLLGVVRGDGDRIRTDLDQVRPRAPRNAVKRFALFKNPAGKVVEKVLMVNGPPPPLRAMNHSENPGVAHGLPGVQHVQYEHEGKTGRLITVDGRILLDTISVGTQTAPGSRLGMYPISPDALGGVLAVLSTLYEQNKCDHLELEYLPVVPSTQAGAIAAYARADIESPTVDVGMDELRHAATHESFLQTQVWQPGKLNIKPSDAISKYFDESAGDLRFSSQAIAFVLAAATFSAAADMGLLYLTYRYTFFSPELEYDVGEISTGNATFSSAAYVTTAVAPVSFPAQAAGAGQRGVTGITLASTDNLMYGVIVSTSGTPPTVTFPDDSAPVQIAVGQGYWVRFRHTGVAVDWTNGSITAYLFRDMASASDIGADANYNDGVALWATSGAQTFGFVMKYRAMSMDE